MRILETIGVLWVVGDRGSAETATLRWLRILPADQFRKYVLVLTSEVPLEMPPGAECWKVYDFVAPDDVAQFVLEFMASRSIDIVNIVGSRIGTDLVPCIKESFPGTKIVIDGLSALEPAVDLLRYVASHYGNVIDRFVVETESQCKALRQNHILRSKIGTVDLDIDDRDESVASLHEKIFVEFAAEVLL